MNKSEWLDQAYYAAVKALRYTNKPFLAEELYQKVLKYVDEPVDARAWGNVIRRLHADKRIYQYGFGRAKTSHMAAKPVWDKVRSQPVNPADEFTFCKVSGFDWPK